MTKEEKQEEERATFYTNPTVIRHLKIHGIPKSRLAFKEMVASGTSEKLDGAKGTALITSLGQITFRDHTQQINIMDKMNGKTISTIPK
jgi:hypothetical protein